MDLGCSILIHFPLKCELLFRCYALKFIRSLQCSCFEIFVDEVDYMLDVRIFDQ